MATMSQLLAEIEAFCTATGIAPTTFGLLAMNDKAFFAQLRGGRRCWPETEARVRRFIDENRSLMKSGPADSMFQAGNKEPAKVNEAGG